METTAHNIGNVGKLVDNPPAIVLQTVTSQLAEWSPMISISLDPLQSTWLASDLHQTLTRSKLPSPGYRHLAPISSTALREQALVQCCDKCLNVNDDYMNILCVLPTAYVTCIHLSQNKVIGISVFKVNLQTPVRLSDCNKQDEIAG